MDKGPFCMPELTNLLFVLLYVHAEQKTNKAPLSCSGKGAIIYSAAGFIESFAAAFVFDFWYITFKIIV